MDDKVTITDVARLAGVSKSTVSRYLNNGYISVEKQERVRAAIAETGFKSNFFAKRLKTKESKLIGIVLPRMDSVSVGKLLSGLARIFEPLGYQGLLLVSGLSTEKELQNIESLQQQGVDGIIVDSVGITERHKEIAKNSGVPMVITGQQDKELDCIKIDDYGAGHMMGAYLRGQGHNRAVFAGVTETDTAVGIERRKGFVDGFTESEDAEQINMSFEITPVAGLKLKIPSASVSAKINSTFSAKGITLLEVTATTTSAITYGEESSAS